MNRNLQERRNAAQAILKAQSQAGMLSVVDASRRSVTPNMTKPKLAVSTAARCLRETDPTTKGNPNATKNQMTASARLKFPMIVCGSLNASECHRKIY